MPFAAPDPGNTLVFTATPVPAGSAFPAGVVPVWTSSDTTNAPVTVDPTGLIATCVLSEAIAVGESVTLSIPPITYTSANGNGQVTTAEASISFTVGSATPPPAPDVTGFTIVQTA